MMDAGIKILIVDDDPEVLFATARIVSAQGYHVLEADTGAACLEIAKKEHPDLILLDVVLPDIYGTEVCKQIKGDPSLKNTFVIMISALKKASNDQADGLDTGADGYIARPISNRELQARINAWVRILRAERERDRLIVELQQALDKVKVLSGLLPICSYCKNIRDDKGYWNRIEAYLQKHSDATFSHSICKTCAKKHFPDYDIHD